MIACWDDRGTGVLKVSKEFSSVRPNKPLIKPSTSTLPPAAILNATLEHPIPPKPVTMVQPKKGQGRHTLGRRSYFHNAPAFVPSTLAIDAPLKYPTTSPTVAVAGKASNTASAEQTVREQRAIVGACATMFICHIHLRVIDRVKYHRSQTK